MEESELLEIAARGEDSRQQFKRDVKNTKSLGAEMAAFANADGGRILLGVEKDGTIHPHDSGSVERLNQLVSNAASECVRPPIYPRTENVSVSGGIVIVVTVPCRLGFPHFDTSGHIWAKDGSDKRRVTAPEEILRMYQTSGLVYADESPVSGSSMADVDTDYFAAFFKKHFRKGLDEQDLSLQQILTNMRLLRDDVLTVTCVLLFGENPAPLVPAYHIKAAAYPGTDIDTDHYVDSEDFNGKLEDQFKACMAFIQRNLRKTQQGQGVNAPGQPEIPQIVFEELLTNAIIHRDFFVSAPIRVFVFDDRIEIISPGHLPNNLTVANILSGNSNMRNPTLASYATRVLPYRGLGSGILRARREYADIEFSDDKEGNKFTAVIGRPNL